MACFYPICAVLEYAPELWGEEEWVRVVISCCAAAPYSILAYLIARDTIQSLDRKELCVALTIGCGILVGVGAAVNDLTNLPFIAVASCFISPPLLRP